MRLLLASLSFAALLASLSFVASLAACAEGATSRPQDAARDALVADSTPGDLAADARSDGAVPDALSDRAVGPDQAPDHAVPDHVVPDHAVPVPDGEPDRGADQHADLCGACGPGMKCGPQGCVCDPATCSGCCDHLGACQPGTSNGLCGVSGAICASCSTSTACMIASCATGSCLVQKDPAASYPCPGSYGTICGGATGLSCLSGLVCATFTAGQSGFCTRYCTTNSNCSAGAPPNVDEACNLLAGSQKLCGFYCAPGSCPSGLSCDVGEGICK